MAITRIGSYSEIKGSSYKIPCKVATTGNITLSGTQTIDGTPVVAGDRVLVKNQNTPSQNGIYIVSSGSWSRAIDMSLDEDVYAGAQVFINSGSTNSETVFFVDTDDPILLDTTNLSFKSPTAAATGTIIDVIYLTGGTTYTPSLGTTKIFIQMVGGGGGGGAADTAQYASASGGGAGGYLESWVTNISSSVNYSYTIASGGTGGSTTLILSGASGGNTTFTTASSSIPASRTFICTGGGGGEGSIAGKVGKFGGTGGTASNGDMNAGGAPGGFAFSRAGTEGNNTGFGGSGVFGGGGVGIQSIGAIDLPGNPGVGYGAGGGGAYAGTATGAAGGNGAPGLIKITEYS